MGAKVVIIGGVAGGASTAARLRRLDETANIIIFERDDYISFANCGLPYYIGGVITKRDRLLVQTPEGMRDRFNIDVRVKSEVIRIDRDNKLVEVYDYKTGLTYDETYDVLVLSPGAYAFKPNIPGIESPNVFSLRNLNDTDRIKAVLDEHSPKRAIIVGGGYVGLEMAENLNYRGLQVTVIELLDHILPTFDFEMAALATVYLKSKGINIICNNGVAAIHQQEPGLKVELNDSLQLEADIVIMSVGVRPETVLAADAGLELGPTHGIKVDGFLRTSDPDIYALGDAAEIVHRISGRPALVPLAGPANRQGRIVADNIAGRPQQYKGSIGTSIAKIFDMAVASVGLNERTLRAVNISYSSVIVHPLSHASYYPGARVNSIKILFSPDEGVLLGAQVVGYDGVDKVIDILAMAIQSKMTVFDLEELELSYAPPFSSAKSSANIAGFVASNTLKDDVGVAYWDEIDVRNKDKVAILDVRTKTEYKKVGSIEGSINIPIDELRKRIDEVPKDKMLYIHCQVGIRSYVVCRMLMQRGYTCKNISGGYFTYSTAKEALKA